MSWRRRGPGYPPLPVRPSGLQGGRQEDKCIVCMVGWLRAPRRKKHLAMKTTWGFRHLAPLLGQVATTLAVTQGKHWVWRRPDEH